MENFEVGTACCWTGHKFVAGEEGMKCVTCEKVMSAQAWQEKRKCFLGHTNAVAARASNASTGRTRRIPSHPSRRRTQQLRWRDPSPPVPSSRRTPQLRWRDSPPPVNPPTPLPRIPIPITPNQNLLRQKWQVILISALSGFFIFVSVSLLIK